MPLQPLARKKESMMEEQNKINRVPIVGVMGSGSRGCPKRSAPLGRWLALMGVHLLTGGGCGVMAAVSEAFFRTAGRKGRVIGIIPGNIEAGAYAPIADYPNPWVEIPIYTHLPLSGSSGTDPLSRNHINILSSDVIVALPGSAGTASEVSLALAYGRPIVAYLSNREQIPGLDPAVRVAHSLTDVEQFVIDTLRLPS